jgi:hypothetical protein
MPSALFLFFFLYRFMDKPPASEAQPQRKKPGRLDDADGLSVAV